MKVFVQHNVRLISVIVIAVICAFSIQLIDLSWIDNDVAIRMTRDTVSRLFVGFVFVLLMVRFGYDLLQTSRPTKLPIWMIVLPGIIVAVNNFPISAYLAGRTILLEPEYTVLLFAIECMSVGFFEEIVFRGVILIVLLQQFPKTKAGMFWAVISSSAIFGLVHIANLFAGAGFGNTMLQVGYSFMLGSLWAVVYLATKNLWYAMLLHALYNFFGNVLFQLGRVTFRYDTVTVVTTVVLAMVVISYYLLVIKRLEPSEIEPLYTPSNE